MRIKIPAIGGKNILNTIEIKDRIKCWMAMDSQVSKDIGIFGKRFQKSSKNSKLETSGDWKNNKVKRFLYVRKSCKDSMIKLWLKINHLRHN